MSIAHHNIMCQTLAQVTSPAVTPERDRAKEHLCPSENGVCHPYDAVQTYSPRTESLFMYV